MSSITKHLVYVFIFYAHITIFFSVVCSCFSISTFNSFRATDKCHFEVPSDISIISLRSEEHTSNSSHVRISYAVFCLKKKITKNKYNIEQKKQKKRNQSQLTSKAVPTTLPRNMHVSYAEI